MLLLVLCCQETTHLLAYTIFPHVVLLLRHLYIMTVHGHKPHFHPIHEFLSYEREPFAVKVQILPNLPASDDVMMS